MALKGRPKGAKNKYSKDIKLRIEQFCSGNFEEFEEGWKSLPPSSPVKYTVFVKLLQIIMPKEIDLTEDDERVLAVRKSIEDMRRLDKRAKRKEDDDEADDND